MLGPARTPQGHLECLIQSSGTGAEYKRGVVLYIRGFKLFTAFNSIRVVPGSSCYTPIDLPNISAPRGA